MKTEGRTHRRRGGRGVGDEVEVEHGCLGLQQVRGAERAGLGEEGGRVVGARLWWLVLVVLGCWLVGWWIRVYVIVKYIHNTQPKKARTHQCRGNVLNGDPTRLGGGGPQVIVPRLAQRLGLVRGEVQADVRAPLLLRLELVDQGVELVTQGQEGHGGGALVGGGGGAFR